MNEQSNIQLHFDVVSCRAMLSCEGRDYVLPDTYPTKEAAAAAAKTFAWERLGLKSGRAAKPSDLPVFQR